tara:strand:+ start:41 stop:226 length:186 start_codon:yes stop_codon:yes gene_type:complete
LRFAVVILFLLKKKFDSGSFLELPCNSNSFFKKMSKIKSLKTETLKIEISEIIYVTPKNQL